MFINSNNSNASSSGYMRFVVIAVLITLVYVFIEFYNKNFNVNSNSIDIVSELDIPTDSLGLTLPEKDRHYLWKTEHCGNILVEYGLKPFVDALMIGNMENAQFSLHSNFIGKVPLNETGIKLNNGFSSVSRFTDSESPYKTLEKLEFINWIFSKREKFVGIPQTKVRLKSLAPINREKLDEEWIGVFQLRMWGEMNNNGPGEIILYFEILINEPVENDILEGSWLKGSKLIKSKSAFSDKYLMRETASNWGIKTEMMHDNWNHGPASTHASTGGVYLCDYNRDGIVDLLINDLALYRGYILYKGEPDGQFTDVSIEVGLPPLNNISLAAIADLDGDGWEDFILGPGLVFQNIEGKKFKNVSDLSNLTNLGNLRKSEKVSGLTFADYDRDGKIDIYVFRASAVPKEGSWIRGKVSDELGNQLLRNVGDWTFENVTEQLNASGGSRSVFSTIWWDANSDGWQDLYVIHEFGNGVLLKNNSGKGFTEHQLTEGPADFGSMGVTFGDFDNDGLPDLYVASMYSSAGKRVIGNLRPDAYPSELMLELDRMVAGSQLYHNEGNLEFERVGSNYDVDQVGWAYGPAMVDLDNDGWLDIFATAGFISRTRDKPDG
ncbi:MAG: VCBS repeat-containing protein [Gammaproteobacteria bacterium]|jgi:hypothetical protein|nr:VCBS repeat-containing protein [Gammaproteobacteria bacterium]|tara:strand:+ start:1058 stop:2881 length:1824 start_codon:yes stop_codon:yes gene_type:complete